MGSTMPDLQDACWGAYDPLNNALGQNPCEVAHILFGVCDSPDRTNDDYNLYRLDPDKGQRRYPPPNQWQATSCICSMASYNLVQACAACQQPTAINSTLWNDWVSNCTMSNINYGRTFPYAIPESTTLPDWAYADNAHGALDMADVFRRITSNVSNWPFNPDSNYSLVSSTPAASTATSSSVALPTSATYGEASAGTIGSAPPGSDDDGSGHSGRKVLIGMLVMVAVLAAIIGAGLWFWVRRKRRMRQRGLRLGSDGHLPGPAFSSHTLADPFSDAVAPAMVQRKDSVSLFLPSETVYSRRGSNRSRSSFTTNSVSTRSYAVAQGSDRLAAGERDPSLWAPSTGYDSRSSAAYTYDDDASDDGRYSPHPRDESISPFADIHRPPRSLVATRNNLHNVRPPHSRPTFYSTEDDISGDDESDSQYSRSMVDPDAESLITLSSDVSKLSRAAPSSSGATYGGAHDDEDDDQDGFTTEQGDEDGFTTEQGEEDDDYTDREADFADDISLSSQPRPRP